MAILRIGEKLDYRKSDFFSQYHCESCKEVGIQLSFDSEQENVKLLCNTCGGKKLLTPAIPDESGLAYYRSILDAPPDGILWWINLPSEARRFFSEAERQDQFFKGNPTVPLRQTNGTERAEEWR